MSDLSDFDRFDCFSELTDRLLEQLPPEAIANAIRLLAMNVAHYQTRYHKRLLGESLRMMNSAAVGEFDDETVTVLSSGMEILANALALSTDWQPNVTPVPCISSAPVAQNQAPNSAINLAA